MNYCFAAPRFAPGDTLTSSAPKNTIGCCPITCRRNHLPSQVAFRLQTLVFFLTRDRLPASLVISPFPSLQYRPSEPWLRFRNCNDIAATCSTGTTLEPLSLW